MLSWKIMVMMMITLLILRTILNAGRSFVKICIFSPSLYPRPFRQTMATFEFERNEDVSKRPCHSNSVYRERVFVLCFAMFCCWLTSQVGESGFQIIAHGHGLWFFFLRLFGNGRLLSHGTRFGKGISQLQLIFIGHNLNQFVHLVGWSTRGRGRIHGTLHILRFHIQVFKLLFKLIHRFGYFIHIHALQPHRHSLDDTVHGCGHGAHACRGFDAGGDGIDARCHSLTIECLILFSYCILPINPCTLQIPLLDRLLQLLNGSFFILFTLFGGPRHLFRRDFQINHLLLQGHLIPHDEPFH
mmetsp:Transcript_29784/g.54539  ORF Transcript_29784/g.54539 Transcript_29784/m.54539 type:complete len:300 (-) Transcript_29784:174-1073(-)